MTTKEIAAAVGKDERTVRRWVAAVADKMSVVADKLSASSPNKPANYTLDETVAIIREGLGDSVADVFRANHETYQAKEAPDLFDRMKMALDPNAKRSDIMRAFSLLATETAELIDLNTKQADVLTVTLPRANAYRLLAETTGSFLLSDVAKKIGMNPQDFCRKLREDKILFYRGPNDGYRYMVPFQEYLDHGYFLLKTITANKHSVEQTRVTPSGELWLMQRYSKQMTLFNPSTKNKGRHLRG